MSEKSNLSRRAFIRNTSILAGGTVAAALGKNANASNCCGGKADPRKIVNYNEKMHYRRLGKTNLMLSETSLGGHWKNRGGGVLCGRKMRKRVRISTIELWM